MSKYDLDLKNVTSAKII